MEKKEASQESSKESLYLDEGLFKEFLVSEKPSLWPADCFPFQGQEGEDTQQGANLFDTFLGGLAPFDPITSNHPIQSQSKVVFSGQEKVKGERVKEKAERLRVCKEEHKKKKRLPEKVIHQGKGWYSIPLN